MNSAILVHGTCDKEEYFSDKFPSLSNSHWLPWLQKQLLIKNIFTQTPEMPDAYAPVYEKWKEEFERFTVDEDTILVGHSCGGGFLVRWLSENKVAIKKLVLVAPWLDPEGKKDPTFFEFTIDPSMCSRFPIDIFISDDDHSSIHTSISMMRKVWPQVIMHEFKGKGHFTYEEMKTTEFPELRDAILGR